MGLEDRVNGGSRVEASKRAFHHGRPTEMVGFADVLGDRDRGTVA